MTMPEPMVEDGWHAIGPAWTIPPGEGRVFVVDGREVVVFRTRAGEMYATQARCPHKDGPLADGILGGTTLVCPLHARKFDVATGAPIGNDCAALATYAVRLGPRGTILLRHPSATPIR